MQRKLLNSLRNLALLALLVTWTLPLHAEEWVRYQAQPGSKVKIDGTSTIHDWTVECGIIGGYMELESNFPLHGKASAPPAAGKFKAKVEVNIPVRQLKSGKTSMDKVMHEAMNEPEHPRISYTLKELSLKSHAAGQPLKFDSKGEITVSGVTKPVDMEVTIEPNGANRLKILGETQLKMTDFGIKPPAPAVGLGLIKTGDEVKITFEWLTVHRPAK